MTVLHRNFGLTAALTAAMFTASCFEENGPAAGGDQGWDTKERAAFYWATQGSRLMPEVWFDALERADGSGRFAAMDNLTRYGFLEAKGSDKPRPIGFARDRQADGDLPNTGLRWYAGQPDGDKTAEPWIGLNCAACHTARLMVGDQELTVDGGPNLLDFQTFIEELDAGLIATRADPARWDAFAGKVLAGKDTPENRAALQVAFDRFVAWQAKTEAMNSTPIRYGFGRLDAVGHILNKVLMFTGAPVSAGNAANAPVSYPFLWGVSWQERVQWNGIARNSRFELPGAPVEYGALGRNTGEVLGVFGDIAILPQPGGAGVIKGYKSSVNAVSLDNIEHQLGRLTAPKWPESLPPIDAGLVETGGALFKTMCSSCHTEPPLSAPDGPTERMLTFQEVKERHPGEQTDIWMACNAYVYAGPTGTMQGTDDIDGKPLATKAPVAAMLATAVRGALLGNKPDLIGIVFRNFLGISQLPVVSFAPEPGVVRSADRQACLNAKDVPTLAYKARPLDGIWATAPYLHNGSVASLYELLLPAGQRAASFWVGNREFDPVKVGYLTTDPGDGQGFLLRTREDNGQPVPGNSAEGHEYGAGALSEPERMALIEYLKSL